MDEEHLKNEEDLQTLLKLNKKLTLWIKLIMILGHMLFCVMILLMLLKAFLSYLPI